jgi:hypothetical protein
MRNRTLPRKALDIGCSSRTAATEKSDKRMKEGGKSDAVTRRPTLEPFESGNGDVFAGEIVT